MRKHGLACYELSTGVRLSVRPSVTVVYFIQTAKDIIELCSPSNVLSSSGVTQFPLCGVLNKRGLEKSPFSANISVYI